MGAIARQLEADVLGVLRASGARVIDKGLDGAGHQTITFELNEQRKTFHFGSSPHMNGCARRNMTNRLKRILRTIPVASPKSQSAATRLTIPIHHSGAPPQATPPKTTLNRSAIAKLYVTLRSMDKLVDRTGMTRGKLTNLMMAAGGQASEMARAERNQLRAVVAKARRTSTSMSRSEPAAATTPKRHLRGDEALKRNILIAKMVWRKKMDPVEVAKMFEMSSVYVAKIAHDHYPLMDTKLS